jgi:predicted ester cyclase
MSTEDNKATMRKFYETMSQGNPSLFVDTFIDPNQVDHSAPPGMPGGIEGAKQMAGMLLTAFPDLHFTVEDMIAEGDKVVARATFSGTQQGAFMGIPPTGKHVMWKVIDINRIAGGKSVEHWMEMDMLGMMQQLGVVPAPGQAS